MTRELNGSELQGFIKQRQLRQVRNLRQAYQTIPRLAIIMSEQAGKVIDTYVATVSYTHLDVYKRQV